jgi:ribonucleotide monophosphatase NagD (HAD superfamily)
MASNGKTEFTMHTGIQALIDRYDGYIVDQFGVLHNGATHLPGADEAIATLQTRYNKKLVILSNSSALEDATMAKLPQLGFDPASFCGAVTSGQEAAQYIIQRQYSAKKALFLTWKTPCTPSPYTFLEACGNVLPTMDPASADFVLLHGCEVQRGPGVDGEAVEVRLGDFHETGDLSSVIAPFLKQCLEHRLPLLCTNPDYIMVKLDNTQAHMPGVIADAYRAMGGAVIVFGKPDRRHFEACIRKLGLSKDRVVHIGDSLHHDIQGANDAGIASIFVTGGVHSEELGSPAKGELPSRAALEELFAKHRQTPTHVVPLLRL